LAVVVGFAFVLSAVLQMMRLMVVPLVERQPVVSSQRTVYEMGW
jgi:hypothetical protein